MIDPEKLNTSLINVIKDKLSAEGKGHSSLVNELTNILFIGKEAIYRRLRNEVPFTFSEAALIAKKLGISLDAMVGSSFSKNIFFEFIQTRYTDPEDIDYFRLREYLDVLKTARGDDNSEYAYASNVFSQYPGFMYEHLLRFYSFKWGYQNNKLDDVKLYSESKVPQELLEVSQDILRETMNIKSTCYIWDSSIFSSVVKDIKYFSSLGFLRETDSEMLKEELNAFIDDLEQVAAKGMFKTGNKVQIYICNTDFDATYSYLKTPKFKVSMMGAFSNYVTAVDDNAYNKMYSWIQSLKKLSTLISESGEIQRTQFFRKQREIVNAL